ADDHLSVGQSQHIKLGTAHLLNAGQEIHLKAGQKLIIEAGDELTLKAGGSFIKLDPGGVSLVGPQVKINAGGSAGKGSGVELLLPTLNQGATPDTARLTETGYGESNINAQPPTITQDRKSTRLNSSHVKISYAVFCLKKNINLLVPVAPYRSCEFSLPNMLDLFHLVFVVCFIRGVRRYFSFNHYHFSLD